MNLCEEHGQNCFILYDGSICPFCDTEQERDVLVNQVEDLEKQLEEKE